MWMNDSDIDQAQRMYRDHPVLGPAVQTVDNLRQWADANSDGWCYWPKPGRAASGLMKMIMRDGTNRFHGGAREDATPEEFRMAMRAVKAFRTKFKATFAIVPLDYPRCDSYADYVAWRKQQTGDVTFGDARAQFPMADPARLAHFMVQYRNVTRRELNLDDYDAIGDSDEQRRQQEDLRDAIDLASDQDQATWLTSGGKVIAAIVPAEQAERGEVRL